MEIYNGGDELVDISNWSLSDGVAVRHVFPEGTLVPADCSVVVFGGGAIGLELPNCAIVQRASDGLLGLNNGGDTITFANSGGQTLVELSYGGEGGENEALVLEGEIYVKHSLAAGSDGALFSPGTLTDGGAFAGCDPECPEVPVFEIWEIQGPGLASLFANQTVLTAGNVVTGVADNGFFMQTPEERSDGDPETSEGIFVFTGGAPGVNVGDVVDVEGEVIEFFDLTEYSRPDLVVVTASGAELPEPILLDESVPSPDQPQLENELERFEGMRVTFAGIATGGYNRFGEVLVVARSERAFREPGIEYPGFEGLPVWDGNPEVFELYSPELGLPDAELSATATITECTGVMTYRFGAYTVLPTALDATDVLQPAPVRDRVPGEFTIATQNLLSLYDDQDDFGEDEVVEPAVYNVRLEKLALWIRDVLKSPDVLAVQEAEKIEVLEDLALEIATLDASIVYTAHLIPGSDPSSRNIGFLVRDSIAVEAVAQIGSEEVLSGGQATFTRPPLVLRGRYVGGGADQPITVINVHLRSRRDIDDFGDAGNFTREKRLAQAEFLARDAQARQEEDPGVSLFIAGDFNAFEFTDGYADMMGVITGTVDPTQSLAEVSDIVEPDLRNHALDLPESERYSIVLDGSAAVFDSIVTSSAATALVTGVAYGRGCADAAVSLAQTDDTPLGASDHDGMVAFVAAGDGPIAGFRRGDANADGNVDITDGVFILNHLFLGLEGPSCPDAADANDEGGLSLSSAVFVLNFLFTGGGDPPPPGHLDCGEDPTDDDLVECDYELCD